MVHIVSAKTRTWLNTTSQCWLIIFSIKLLHKWQDLVVQYFSIWKKIEQNPTQTHPFLLKASPQNSAEFEAKSIWLLLFSKNGAFRENIYTHAHPFLASPSSGITAFWWGPSLHCSLKQPVEHWPWWNSYSMQGVLQGSTFLQVFLTRSGCSRGSMETQSVGSPAASHCPQRSHMQSWCYPFIPLLQIPHWFITLQVVLAFLRC